MLERDRSFFICCGRSTYMIKPAYFVGIGAAKSGTSWLAHYLAGHSEIAFSPIKELHYFDAMFLDSPARHWNRKWSKILDELNAKYQVSPDSVVDEKIRCIKLRLEMVEQPTIYRDYFDALVDSRHKAFGEVTPAYSMLPKEGFQSILDLYPKAKFLFIMRDPVSRYLSQIQFSQTILEVEGKDRIVEFDPDFEAIRHLANREYIERGNYKGTLETLQNVTGLENICTMFYENIFFGGEKGVSELRKLCEFLGVSPLAADVNLRVNPSDELKFSESVVRTVKNQLSPIYEYVFKNFGEAVPEFWYR